MKSMTGFGEARGESEVFVFVVTLRSVNHRSLDLSFRLRDAWKQLEGDLRLLLERGLERGRVEVGIDVRRRRPATLSVRLDDVALGAILDAVRASPVLGKLPPPAVGDLLRLPGVLEVEAAEDEVSDDDRAALSDTLERALAQLLTARREEGLRLRGALERGLDGLEHQIEALAERRETVRSELPGDLRRRLEELLSDRRDGGAGAGGLDSDRLEQEVALLVERSDVQEELDRLGSHVEGFRELLDGQAESRGRRMGFLVQEMLREVNTIGSKCRDAAMAGGVVEAKVLCEQLREQVANVE